MVDLKKWNAEHDIYATIDRRLDGTKRVIMMRGNHMMIGDKVDEITEELLEEMYEEGFRGEDLSD